MRSLTDVVSAWPMVGRVEELALCEERLGDGRVRGVVVTGAAGVGKTRLGREMLGGGVGGWASDRASEGHELCGRFRWERWRICCRPRWTERRRRLISCVEPGLLLSSVPGGRCSCC